jgi:hypothetical protein
MLQRPLPSHSSGLLRMVPLQRPAGIPWGRCIARAKANWPA